MEMPEGLLVFHSEFEKGTLRPKDPFQTEKIFFSADPISKELSEELFPFGDMATQEFNLGKGLDSNKKKSFLTSTTFLWIVVGIVAIVLLDPGTFI